MIKHWDVEEMRIQSEDDIQCLVEALRVQLATDGVRTVVRVWRGTE